jgi:transposase-like protein
MEAMTKHRSHSAAFKRQVAEEFIAGETLHALSQRHDISRQLIRIWVGKFEAGALNAARARGREGGRPKVLEPAKR